MKLNIRFLYLYTLTFIGLVLMVVASISLIQLSINTLVFKDADRYYEPRPYYDNEDKEQAEKQFQIEKEAADKELVRNRQRSLSNGVAMLVVGTPLYLYHWRLIKTEKQTRKK